MTAHHAQRPPACVFLKVAWSVPAEADGLLIVATQALAAQFGRSWWHTRRCDKTRKSCVTYYTKFTQTQEFVTSSNCCSGPQDALPRESSMVERYGLRSIQQQQQGARQPVTRVGEGPD